MRLSLLILSLAAMLTASCTRKPEMPVSSTVGPAFDPVAFFDGNTRHVIESRDGVPAERIVTDSQGKEMGPIDCEWCSVCPSRTAPIKNATGFCVQRGRPVQGDGQRHGRDRRRRGERAYFPLGVDSGRYPAIP